MKKLIITIFAFVLMLSLVGCNSNPKKVDENTTEETSPEIKFSQMHADFYPYKSIEELADFATNIFEAKVTNIYFEIFDITTGKSVEEIEPSDKDNLMLYTVYELEVNKSYKGTKDGKVYLKLIGGLEGYKPEEQLKTMIDGGMDMEKRNIIPILENVYPLLLGETRIFFTKDNGYRYNVTPNYAQYSYSAEKEIHEDNFKYEDVKTFLENGTTKAK